MSDAGRGAGGGAPGATAYDALATIAAKRDGAELDGSAIAGLVTAYVAGAVPDYQMAAFLMAGYLRGFTDAEAVHLTTALVDSGDRLDLSQLRGPTVDKHSTGGVADSTTLVVAPLAAELGLQVLKLSGRGLGHTGGTLDKLEAVPGMRTALSEAELIDQVERIGLAVGAQTADLVPADRMLYALRDVTGTVGNVALIASSVMSKKLAGGAASIVLDVKIGSGAFAKDVDAGRALARLCVSLGTAAGRSTAAVLSDMSQPLGERVGNAAEVAEAVEILRGERAGRLRELSVDLVGELAALAGIATDAAAGRAAAVTALESGAGLERFGRFVEAQGGDRRVVDDLTLLPRAPVTVEVAAPRDGWLAAVDGEAVGTAAARLGAGRRRKEDTIDPAVGLDLPTRIGDRVTAGQVIGLVHARSADAAAGAAAALLAALAWTDLPVDGPLLVHERIGPD